MKYLIILILILSSFQTIGQGCGLVSGTRDKETGIETRGGVVSSKDFYSLLIQRRFNEDSLNYLLFLNAASRYMLSDSILNSTGTFELQLLNGEVIKIENVEYQNDPMGLGASIGFTVWTTGTSIEQIINSPIQKLTVVGILETEFSERKQKQQQKILNCLKNYSG